MPRERFFTAGMHVSGDRVALDDADVHKLVTVLRRESGSRIEVVDGAGSTFAARLDMNGRAVHAVLGDRLEGAPVEVVAQIVLVAAIPKGQKMDFIVEKATELGVQRIVPLRSERVTGDHTGEHKVQRWQRIAKAAAAQSGRAVVPVMSPIVEWADVRAMCAHFERTYVAWEEAELRPLRERFECEVRGAHSILLVIGPEGGFSAAEIAAVQAVGATTISLGSRILRTETAALAVLTALLYARGDM